MKNFFPVLFSSAVLFLFLMSLDLQSFAQGVEVSDSPEVKAAEVDPNGGALLNEESLQKTALKEKAVKEKPEKPVDPELEQSAQTNSMMAGVGLPGISDTTAIQNNVKRFGLDDHELINQSFVNLLSGSAEVRLPLQVPTGINGLVPELTLQYSSQLVNETGPFGFGWEMEFGQIKRLNKFGVREMYDTPVYHITLGPLKGELIFLGEDAGVETYGMRRESEFARIQFTPANDAWVVTMKNGVVYRLGTNAQSRLQDDGGDMVFAWDLEEVEEPHGNKIVYEYERLDGMLFPKKISYGAPGAGTHPFEIRFLPFYTAGTPTSNRIDQRIDYSRGFYVNSRFVVDSIEVYADSVLRLSYSFDYQADAIDSRTNLKALTVTGINGSSTVSQEMNFGYYSLEDGESNFYHRNNLLKTLHFHQGGEIVYDYMPSTQLFDGAGALANNKPYFPLFVVTSVAKKDFTGRNDVTTYFYSDGHFFYDSPFERELAGFGRTTVTDPIGQKTIYYFHQGGGYDGSSLGEASDSWSLIGQLYRVETLNSSSQIMQRVTNKWETSSLSTDRHFPRQTATVITLFNSSGSGRSTATETTYDTANGNVTQVLELGEVSANNNGTYTDSGNDDRKTVITYASNTTDHLLSYPSNQKHYDENNSLKMEVSYKYDGLTVGLISNGDKTQVIQEFFEETRQLTVQQQFNSAGQVTKIIDPLLRETTIAYDTLSLYPATITNDLTQTTSFSYDLVFGQVTQSTDPNSLVSQTVLDGLGRVLEQSLTDPNNSNQLSLMQSFVYSESSFPHSVQAKVHLDATTVASTYSYLDGFGRVLQTRAQDAVSNQYIVSNTVYDELGRVEEQTLPVFASGSSYNLTHGSSIKTTTAYDVLNRPTQIVDGNGTTTIAYDRWDKTVTDAESNPKKFTSDAYGRLHTVVETNNSTNYTTTYDYNSRDLIVKITDSQGNLRNFSYNSLSRLTQQEDLHDSSDSTFGIWTYEYDDAGNVTEVTNPKAQVIVSAYDELNRVETEQLQGDNSTLVTYTYDSGTNGIGRLTGVVGPNHTWTPAYDKRGRVTSETNNFDSTNYTKSYTYTRFDRPATITMPDGVVLTYTYNSIGQISAVTSNYGNVVDTLEYSPLSQVKKIDYSNGLFSSMTYDAAMMYRMTAKATKNDAQTTTFQNISYAYDNVGNITNLAESSGSSANKTAAYVYDDLYRLTSATITNTTSGSNYTHTFSFDSIGNILTKSDQGSYTYAETGKVNPHGVTLVDNGSGTTKTYTYDDNGNMTQEVFDDGTDTITKSMTWDHLNRMTQTTVNDGTNTTTISYTYDQGGRRLKKSVNDGTTTVTTKYPFADFEVTTTNSTKTTVNADTQHVATIENTGTSQIVYSHHDDHLGGANIVTSVSGNLVQVLDYFPFGSVRVDDKSSTYDSTQKFTGHELDDDTGLYYAQARYYDAETGRFISQDPLQMRVGELMKKFKNNPQGLNFYSYSGNNPIVMIDPSGETFGNGLSVNFNTGFGIFSGSISISLEQGEDGSAGIAISTSAGTGSGTPGLSFSAFTRFTDKENVKELRGDSISGSMDVCYGGCLGVEIGKPLTNQEHNNNTDSVTDVTFKAGIGKSSVIPGVTAGYTDVIEIISAPPELINMWTVNPDGTVNRLEYGKDPQAPIPGNPTEKSNNHFSINNVDNHSDSNR